MKDRSNESGEGIWQSALVKQYKEVPRHVAGNYCAEHVPFVLRNKNHINQYACNSCDLTWHERVNQTIRRHNI